MYSRTSKKAYQRHEYSGPRKSLKRVRGGLRQFHGDESRLKVWRSEDHTEDTKKPVDEEISIDKLVTPQYRTYARVIPKLRLKATYSTPSTSTVTTQRPDGKDQAPAKRALNEASTPRGEHKRPRLDSTVTTQRLVGKDQAAAKRALNEASTPRGEHKRPRLDQSKRVPQRSYPQAASATLNVAITCERTGILSREVADQVLAAIQRQIILEACSPKLDTPGPTFNAKPLVAGGVVKLWCGNDHTLAWLRKTVSDLSLPTNVSLVVKSESEIQERTRCGIVIPDEQGIYGESTNIGRALSYQNPWVDIKRWVLLFADKQAEKWFVVVGVPVDQIPTLMEAGRRLSIGLGAVYVKFQGRNGRFTDAPQGWDPATGTIGEVPNQPQILSPASTQGGDGFDEGDPLAVLRLEGDEEGLASDGIPFVGV